MGFSGLYIIYCDVGLRNYWCIDCWYLFLVGRILGIIKGLIIVVNGCNIFMVI